MAVDVSRLNQVVSPVAGNIPGVVSLLEQVNRSPGSRYIAIGLTNAFISIPVNNVQQKQFTCSWQG